MFMDLLFRLIQIEWHALLSHFVVYGSAHHEATQVVAYNLWKRNKVQKGFFCQRFYFCFDQPETKWHQHLLPRALFFHISFLRPRVKEPNTQRKKDIKRTRYKKDGRCARTTPVRRGERGGWFNSRKLWGAHTHCVDRS